MKRKLVRRNKKKLTSEFRSWRHTYEVQLGMGAELELFTLAYTHMKPYGVWKDRPAEVILLRGRG